MSDTSITVIYHAMSLYDTLQFTHRIET